MSLIYLIRKARTVALGLFLLVAASGAWAGCTGGGNTYTLAFPSKISVARDLPVGSLLTGWVTSPVVTDMSCSGSATINYGMAARVGSAFNTSSGQTSTYTVWNTNVPGVGIAVGWNFKFQTNNCSYGGGWYGWRSATAPWWGFVCTNTTGSGSGSDGTGWAAQVTAALVKTGATATGNTISGTVIEVVPEWNSKVQSGDSFVMTPVTIVPMTCSTPDVNVPMGTFKTTDFASVGSLSPGQAAPVNLQFTNCPGADRASTGAPGTGWINTVKYYIQPTTTVASNVGGLTTGAGAATGLGIQLFTSSGAVFPLGSGSPQTLSGYNSGAGGSYTVPLTARYYRTGTVTAGTANATMTLYVSYQ